MRGRPMYVAVGLALLAPGPALAAEVEYSKEIVEPADSSAEAAPAASSTQAAPSEPLFSNGRLNAQWLWAKDKAIPGLGLNMQRPYLDFDLELSLLWTTASSQGFDGSFLGAIFGIFLSFVPLRTEQVQLGAGLGADIHYLGGIYEDVAEVALAPRVFARVRLIDSIALFATARTYLLQSSGLELGTERDGSHGSPVLFGTGVSWRLP